jgi:hypothetical protein
MSGEQEDLRAGMRAAIGRMSTAETARAAGREAQAPGGQEPSGAGGAVVIEVTTHRAGPRTAVAGGAAAVEVRDLRVEQGSDGGRVIVLNGQHYREAELRVDGGLVAEVRPGGPASVQ